VTKNIGRQLEEIDGLIRKKENVELFIFFENFKSDHPSLLVDGPSRAVLSHGQARERANSNSWLISLDNQSSEKYE